MDRKEGGTNERTDGRVDRSGEDSTSMIFETRAHLHEAATDNRRGGRRRVRGCLERHVALPLRV